MRSWLILGAGYTGERLATALVARDDRVVVTRRSAAVADVAARTGARPAIVDLAAPAATAALAAQLELGGVVVVAAPPDAAGLQATAIAAAAAQRGSHRIIYLSSTGVYGPAGGAWVDETCALAPTSAAGRARQLAEVILSAGACPCVPLRVAGIYGPGRGVIARLRAGTYRLVGDGAPQISRIHVDDLVTAVLAVGDAPAPGAVYNVADREPCSSRELVDAACAALDLPPPPVVPLAGVDPEVAAMLTADRRIDARRLTAELGWTPRYPSWRDALRAGAC